MPTPLREQLQATLGVAYTLQRELGRGGMSRVFVAHDEALGRDVVVKVLAPELAAGLSANRFTREITLAAGLQEPHIVPVLTAGVTAEGLPYYTMPFVAGESLRARLTAGPVPRGEAVRILRDVALALGYAHRRGVVHRDIKPDNVLLHEGTAVVADFGIAKALAASKALAPAGPSGAALTQLGMSLGTPAYMAPEQVAGDEVNAQADLYAWGVVAYEILAGRHPFAGKTTAQQLFAAQLTEMPPALGEVAPAVPPPLAALVMRCLAKDPAQRPADATEVLAGLDGATLSPPHAVPSSLPSWSSQRRRALVGAAVLLGVGGIGLAAWRARAGGGPATTVGAAVTAVAVLPFANASGDTTANYFADGMTDELATALAKVPDLRVASRTSSYAFRTHAGLDARAIAAKLGVGAIVEGSVRRAGDQVRVTAQLTRGSDGQSLWADAFTASADSVFVVQARLTQAIVAAVAPALAGRPSGAAAVARAAEVGTRHPAAYDAYLRARYELNQRGAGVRRSIPLFQQAVTRDPAFAAAWAGLTSAWALLSDFDPNVVRAMAADSARWAATRAIALDSLAGEPYAALGYSLASAGQLDSGVTLLRRSVVLEPRQPVAHRWLGLVYRRSGQGELAEQELRTAVALDPLSAISVANLASSLAARPSTRDEARLLARRAVALEPHNFGAAQDAALALFLTGDFRESLDLARALGADPSRPGALAEVWLIDLAALGQHDSAAALMRVVEHQSRTMQSLRTLAVGAAALGQWDRAFVLGDTVIQQSGQMDLVRVSAPLWRPVADDPRLLALCRRARRDCGPVITNIKQSAALPTKVR